MTWIAKNAYLTQAEMENNALLVYRYLKGRGWTNNAIAGLLGNMESESTINPAIWQSLHPDPYNNGYGLVQWTPANNYLLWAAANGHDITDGNAQLLWIDTVTESAGQWIATDAYPLSFAEFKKSTESPFYLASAFLKNFERAGVEVEEERRLQAAAWLVFINKNGGGGESGGSHTTTKKKGYNFLIFGRRTRNA